MCLQICEEAIVPRCVAILDFWLSVLLQRAPGDGVVRALLPSFLTTLGAVQAHFARLGCLLVLGQS